MQHFPRIRTPFDPIKVPYKGGKYRGGNFATYLEDHDPPFDLERLQQHDFGPHSQLAIAEVLQEWLYFGLLSEALQLDIQVEDFIEWSNDARNKQDRFITTEKLPDHIRRWRFGHENAKSNPSELAQRKHRTTEALAVSHKAWSQFEDFSAIVGSEIELSIQLLGCAIEHAVTSVYEGIADAGVDTWIDVNQAPWRRTRSPYVEERMKKMGWCPSVIRQLGQPYKLSLQTFVSLLTPSFSNDSSVHAGCQPTDIACRWKNIDERTYTTKHAEQCECPILDPEAFLQVNEEDLRQILQRGEIPIVYLDTQKGDRHAELRVVSYRYELQYTALSHVWADGLGNPQANALPLCQVRRIISFLAKDPDSWMQVSKTPPTRYFDSVWRYDETENGGLEFTAADFNSKPLYFWIDTLCVPPRAQDKELRKSAIKNMRAVYNRANRVFVLDADLLATPGTIDTLSAQELLARVNASSWVRRLWTLQEALLAKNLLFQLKEEAFRIIQPPDQVDNFFLHFYDNEIGYYANNTDFMMRSRALNYSEHGKVASVWSSSNGRSTSHNADEVICVASLLDMDLEALLDVQEDNRIDHMWRTYTEFPLGVLCRPADKLEDPTLPWALAHLSDCATIPAPTIVTVTQRNGVLHFWHHGLIIAEQLRHTPARIIAVKIDEDVYFIRENLKSNNKSWEGIDFTSAARFAIVLGQDSPRPIDGCLGALIKIQAEATMGRQKDEKLKGEYMRAVSIVKRGSAFDIPPKCSMTVAEKSDRETIYCGTWVLPEQEWEVRGNATER